MFTEILRIKPVLDTATTRQMEETLSTRFARVAQRFGGGLKAVIKGSFLGISLGLISKLLNPIEALEDKIKKLLGEGTDIKDLADKLGSSPGELKQLEAVSETLGVKPEQFKEMITKYAQAIEKGREELNNPFEPRSETTNTLKEFVGEKDIVKSFTNFLTSLQAAGKGEGSGMIWDKGELRKRTGLETRQAAEKNVFGEVQSGGMRRLIDANIPEETENLPGIDKLNQAVDKASELSAQKRALDVQNQTEDFVNSTGRLNGKMITQMAEADKIQAERDTKQLDSFTDLKKASIAIEKVQALLVEGSTTVSKGIGYLADLSTFVAGLKNSRLFKGIFGRSE